MQASTVPERGVNSMCMTAVPSCAFACSGDVAGRSAFNIEARREKPDHLKAGLKYLWQIFKLLKI